MTHSAWRAGSWRKLQLRARSLIQAIMLTLACAAEDVVWCPILQLVVAKWTMPRFPRSGGLSVRTSFWDKCFLTKSREPWLDRGTRCGMQHWPVFALVCLWARQEPGQDPGTCALCVVHSFLVVCGFAVGESENAPSYVLRLSFASGCLLQLCCRVLSFSLVF